MDCIRKEHVLRNLTTEELLGCVDRTDPVINELCTRLEIALAAVESRESLQEDPWNGI